MQTLVDKINEQIEIFQTNANLQLTKNNKAPVRVHAKRLWRFPNS